jgi:hypothetical protein
MNTQISFISKNEATFICPKQTYERFREFLINENITILSFSEEGDYVHIYVDGVDKSESDELISKYNVSLRG